MYQRIMFYLFILIGVTVNAQTINVRGKVSNKAGEPVSNVIVELLRQNLKDTTGTDGNYAIVSNNIVLLPVLYFLYSRSNTESSQSTPQSLDQR